MILLDTSVWVDYFRGKHLLVVDLLNEGEVFVHPFVLGELALGHLPNRAKTLLFLSRLKKPVVANDTEVRALIERHKYYGRGIGYIDLHLLASASLTPETLLWTSDKRLHAAASELSLCANLIQ